MNNTTPIDNHKLFTWYITVGWAKKTLQQKVAHAEVDGLDTAYDTQRLKELEDLEQFLKMSWDQWLHGLETPQTAVEESK